MNCKISEAKSNYKLLGDYITKVNLRNKDLKTTNLKGLSMTKEFRESTSNIIGVDLSKYKLVPKNHFACDFMSVIRVHKLPVVHQNSDELIIVSPAYTVFKVIDENILNPEYLMMWFRRPEFDRYADFRCDSAIRGGFKWDELGEVELPIPSIEKQHEIVKEYNTVANRITLNETINKKLEDTAQALYKHWFVDFEFPNEQGKPYKSNGGKMVFNEELDLEIPLGWESGKLSEISNITMGQSPSGKSFNSNKLGEIFYQGRTDFGFRFPNIRNYTTEPKRRAKKGNILMSVRAPVGDLNIANNNCCIGRGLSALNSKDNCNSFLFYLMQNIRNQFDVANGEGTIFGSITKDGLHEIKILKPNTLIIEEFEKLVKIIDSRIEKIALKTSILMPIKSLLLSKMSKVAIEKETVC
ncbi:restriction endonuclease subunit S [Tenacibaculum finnmarkense]|uniref:restriction endonuclease subunit S n=1 Tax=Tenacibaculum finnmarkense TaxID=2781243 RepID=UPI001EFA5D40|nr:restriction endonuclease subunit S [Tenacibaculum finnmarkense]MCG8761953.1 restriction endonuclease subunit S [Tenacibaculum finnmarkense]MCG8787328.1 restriction endonuclease subunit S [Tenacibaculum finnmarkense]MCG8807427.1 restriction endonuclease subunit S [Tenacibaculum finnmarkense]MCG8817646.1 restriction endonuclease subunit S [Tenacibaculum finnmarkense]